MSWELKFIQCKENNAKENSSGNSSVETVQRRISMVFCSCLHKINIFEFLF